MALFICKKSSPGEGQGSLACCSHGDPRSWVSNWTGLRKGQGTTRGWHGVPAIYLLLHLLYTLFSLIFLWPGEVNIIVPILRMKKVRLFSNLLKATHLIIFFKKIKRSVDIDHKVSLNEMKIFIIEVWLWCGGKE